MIGSGMESVAAENSRRCSDEHCEMISSGIEHIEDCKSSGIECAGGHATSSGTECIAVENGAVADKRMHFSDVGLGRTEKVEET